MRDKRQYCFSTMNAKIRNVRSNFVALLSDFAICEADKHSLFIVSLLFPFLVIFVQKLLRWSKILHIVSKNIPMCSRELPNMPRNVSNVPKTAPNVPENVPKNSENIPSSKKKLFQGYQRIFQNVPRIPGCPMYGNGSRRETKGYGNIEYGNPILAALTRLPSAAASDTRKKGAIYPLARPTRDWK